MRINNVRVHKKTKIKGGWEYRITKHWQLKEGMCYVIRSTLNITGSQITYKAYNLLTSNRLIE